MNRLLAVILILAQTVLLQAEDFRSLNNRGVREYQRQNYDSSLQYFRQAQELEPENKIIDFNMGNALHQQGRYEEALSNYEHSLIPGESTQSSQAYYNIGNTHFRAGAFDKAIAAYKQALNLNPDDRDTKYNLELALKIQEQQQQQKNQDQQNQDQQNQNQQNKQDPKQEQQDSTRQNQEQQQEQNKEQQDQQQQNQNQQQPNQEDQEQKQDSQKQDQQKEQNQEQQKQGEQQESEARQSPQDQGEAEETKPMQLDQQRAQALLEGLNEDEKQVLKQLLRQKAGVSAYKGKNW